MKIPLKRGAIVKLDVSNGLDETVVDEGKVLAIDNEKRTIDVEVLTGDAKGKILTLQLGLEKH